MKSPFAELLRRAMRQHEVVSIHNDPEDYGNAYCGFVESLGAEECRLRTYRRYGDPDGWFALRLAEVLFVDTGGGFEQRIGYFAAQTPATVSDHDLPPIKRGPILLGTLRQAKALGVMVSVGLVGATHTIGGLVEDVTDVDLGLREITPYGETGGRVTLALGMALHVSVGTLDCLRIQHLYEHQAEFAAYRKAHIL